MVVHRLNQHAHALGWGELADAVSQVENLGGAGGACVRVGLAKGVEHAARFGGDGVGYDLNDTVTLGTVPAACTQVIGAVKFDLSSNYPAGFRFDRWHMVMGGTMLWVMDGEPGFQDQLGSNFGCSQYCAYHFSVSGGVVRLHRRVVIDRTPFQYVIRPHRLIYKLRCGAWS